MEDKETKEKQENNIFKKLWDGGLYGGRLFLITYVMMLLLILFHIWDFIAERCF